MSPTPRDKVHFAGKIATVIEALAAEGIPAEAVLADVGLSPDELLSPATKVSAAQVLQIYRNAIRLSGDLLVAYRVGARFSITTYGIYGFAALSSPSFRETAAFAVAYHQLAAPVIQVDFREAAATAAWIVTPLPSAEIDAPLSEFIVRLHMAGFLSLHRKLMGTAFKPARVEYALPQLPGGHDETAIFDCPVLYGHRENRFVIDSAWLDRQPDFGNDFVYAEFRRLCDDLLRQVEAGSGIAGQARKLILAGISRPGGIEHVARSLNMSGRSLRRRLRAEGTSFRRLADEMRVQLAITYVRDSDLSIEDIAFALGFSDAASFRHAFRRWTKATPRDYRNGRIGAGP